MLYRVIGPFYSSRHSCRGNICCYLSGVGGVFVGNYVALGEYLFVTMLRGGSICWKLCGVGGVFVGKYVAWGEYLFVTMWSGGVFVVNYEAWGSVCW